MPEKRSPVDVEFDVVVVGAGPVGQVLALLLSARGHRVMLVERWAMVYPLPRAVAAAHDVRRVLDLLDLGPELDGLFEPWGCDDQRITFEGVAGEVLVETRFEQSSVSGQPEMSGFSQPDLEELLDRRGRTQPLHTTRRHKALVALCAGAGDVVVPPVPPDGLAPGARGGRG